MKQITEIWIHNSYLTGNHSRIEANIERPKLGVTYSTLTGEAIPHSQYVLDKHEQWIKENMTKFILAQESQDETEEA